MIITPFFKKNLEFEEVKNVNITSTKVTKESSLFLELRMDIWVVLYKIIVTITFLWNISYLY
jgi:hypothetical protein